MEYYHVLLKVKLKGSKHFEQQFPVYTNEGKTKVYSGGSRILCLGGLMGRLFLFGGANGGLSAEGAKLRLPKARSPSRLGGLRERRKLPQRGLRRSSRNRCNFEHFKRKWSAFLDPVNLTFLGN